MKSVRHPIQKRNRNYHQKHHVQQERSTGSGKLSLRKSNVPTPLGHGVRTVLMGDASMVQEGGDSATYQVLLYAVSWSSFELFSLPYS